MINSNLVKDLLTHCEVTLKSTVGKSALVIYNKMADNFIDFGEIVRNYYISIDKLALYFLNCFFNRSTGSINTYCLRELQSHCIKLTCSFLDNKTLRGLYQSMCKLVKEDKYCKLYDVTSDDYRITLRAITNQGFITLLVIRNNEYTSWDAPVDRNSICFYLCNFNGEKIAWFQLSRKPHNCGVCHITNFAVSGSHYEKGIGKRLLAVAEDTVKLTHHAVAECSGVAPEIDAFLLSKNYTRYLAFINPNSNNIVGCYYKILNPTAKPTDKIFGWEDVDRDDEEAEYDMDDW